MRVSFHFNVVDPNDYVLRLSRKVLAQHPRMVVHAPVPVLSQLSGHLWAAFPGTFLAHATPEDAETVRARSRIVLIDRWDLRPHDVVVNLDMDAPLPPTAVVRVVEIVGSSDEQRSKGRQRWRQYSASGLTLDGHDALNAKG